MAICAAPHGRCLRRVLVHCLLFLTILTFIPPPQAVRESKLAQIHQQAADRARAGSRAGSIDLANGPGTGGRSSVDDSVGEHGVNNAGEQGAGTGTMGVDANGTAIGAGDRA